MPTSLLAATTVLVGMLLATQPLINARAGAAAGHPVYGALVSVTVSTLALALAALALRLPAPDLRALASAPAVTWTGGLIGALVVLTALTATPRLGAAATVALFIAGQLGASLLLDQRGWLGVPLQPITPTRLLGVACLVAGVVLIRWR